MAADTAEMSLDTVRRFMAASGPSGRAERNALLHEQCVVSTAAGLPYSGEYRGPQEFFQLMAKMNELLEFTPGPIVQRQLANDIVVAQFELTFTARSSGKSVKTAVVELYTVRDHKITELDVYYKDPQAIASLVT